MSTILITGASSGFGELTAHALADAGHIVFASMRDAGGVNAGKVDDARRYSESRGVDLRTVELDVRARRNAPYLAPYFAAKAAMESLAISYADELSGWGIETSIVTPGVYIKGTSHFEHSGHPADQAVAQAYANGPTKELADRVEKGHAAVTPDGMDAGDIARAIVDIVGRASGKRPFHVTIDPAEMGYEVMAMMHDRIRGDVFRRMGLADVLIPRLNVTDPS